MATGDVLGESAGESARASCATRICVGISDADESPWRRQDANGDDDKDAGGARAMSVGPEGANLGDNHGTCALP